MTEQIGGSLTVRFAGITSSVDHDLPSWRSTVDLLAPSTQTNDLLIDADWRERRHINRRTGSTLRSRHREFYTRQLRDRTTADCSRSVPELLQSLSEIWGLPWSDIARMVGVSVPALRKWRKNINGTTPENHRRLAALAAFFETLADKVADPVAWVLMSLLDGFNVSVTDVYSEKVAPALIDFSASNIDASELLDEIDPDWRTSRRSEYDVIIADDGLPSLRPRGRLS